MHTATHFLGNCSILCVDFLAACKQNARKDCLEVSGRIPLVEVIT